jgi:hypothetical protein
MRKFRARAGCTIWGDWGYVPIPRGTLVRVSVSRAGLLAVPAELDGRRGFVAVDDLVDFPNGAQFTQGGKARIATPEAPAPGVLSDTTPPRSARLKACHAGGAE